MEIQITNIEELRRFITEHFETLTENEYCELIRGTFDLMPLGKPENVETAIQDINRSYDFLKTLKPNEEKPLFFIEQEVIDFDFIQILNRIPTK
jgi:hypothetical protein